MAVNEIRVGDIGTVFEITMMDDAGIVDLTDLSSAQFTFEKPSGATVVKTATPDGDPTTGILRYTTVTGDLDEAGCWQIQAYLVFPGGSWRSDIGQFHVYANL